MSETEEKRSNRLYDVVLRNDVRRNLEVVAAHAVWTENDLFLADEEGFTVFWAPSHVVLYCAVQESYTCVKAPREHDRATDLN